MSYIGASPVVGNFQVCDAISVVNNQAAYTMQVGGANVLPESANHMLVSLNGILQKPNGSFTISGSTITFSSNLVTGDVIDFIQLLGDVLDLGVPSDGTVSTAKLADSSVSLAKLTATGTKDATTFLRGDNTFAGAGITGADQWRLTSGFTGDQLPLLNLERNDNPSFTGIGTAMSLSSGIFTFPSTGIWLVSLHTENYMNGNDREINGRIQVTQNNSTYVQVARGAAFINGVGANTHTATDCSSIVDVTDTSNVKVQFGVATDQNSTTIADTNQNATFMTFIRLGDT